MIEMITSLRNKNYCVVIDRYFLHHIFPKVNILNVSLYMTVDVGGTVFIQLCMATFQSFLTQNYDLRIHQVFGLINR